MCYFKIAPSSIVYRNPALQSFAALSGLSQKSWQLLGKKCQIDLVFIGIKGINVNISLFQNQNK